jgi:conjugal transfer pilus assembly protein TraA
MKKIFAGMKKYGLASIALTAVAGTAMASAGSSSDTSFQSILNLLTGWATGTLGRSLAIAAFLIGMGMGIVRQSAMAVVLGITFALVLGYGPAVIGNIFTFSL